MNGHVDPTKESFSRFKSLATDTAIHMLNLVRLRAEAAYPDARRASGLDGGRREVR